MIEIGWVEGWEGGYINIGNSTSSCQLQNVMTEKCRQYINKHFSSSLRFWYIPAFFVHRFISLNFFSISIRSFYSFRLSLRYSFICSSTDLFIRLFIYLFHYLFTLFAEQILGCICKRDHLFLFKMAEHSTCVVFRQRLSLPLRLPSRFIHHHHHHPSFEPAPSSPCVFAFYNSVSSVTFIFKLMSRSKRYLPFFIVILKLLFILFHCVVKSTLIINTS